MPLLDYLFGRHLATDEEGEQRVGVLAGIPDARARCAGIGGVRAGGGADALDPAGRGRRYPHIGPISTLIILLLMVVYFSYRQTISAYPHGGGSYTVAKENLGVTRRSLCRGCAFARLRSGRGCRHFGGRGGAGLGAAGTSAAHAVALPDHSGDDHADQPARGTRVGSGVHDSHVPVHRFLAGRTRHRRGQVAACGGTARSDRAAGGAGCRPRSRLRSGS